MKIPKIDFKKIAMCTAGEAAMLFGLEEMKKIKFVANAKPGMKGAIYKAIAAFVPSLLGKHKNSELVTGAVNTLSIAGTSQLLAAFMPDKVGKFANIGGYEDYPINGPGYEMEEQENVDGPNEEDDSILQ